MVPFAGYELPVQYEGLGVKSEHLHCRAKGCASLFDVSHMLEPGVLSKKSCNSADAGAKSSGSARIARLSLRRASLETSPAWPRVRRG